VWQSPLFWENSQTAKGIKRTAGRIKDSMSLKTRLSGWLRRGKTEQITAVAGSKPGQEPKSEPVLQSTVKEAVTVIVPAFNEEGRIKSVLEPLKVWQQADPGKRHVVVVDDGSTDRTAKIARQMGVKVIYSDPEGHKNKGKARAFAEGAKYAKEKGSQILVTLDADLNYLKPKQVNSLIAELGKRKLDMLIGWTREWGQFEQAYGGKEFQTVGGQRAFRIKALSPLINNNQKWRSMMYRFGLETALNHLIRKQDISETVFFQAAVAHRTEKGSRKRQMDQMLRVEKVINARQKRARTLKVMRRQRRK